MNDQRNDGQSVNVIFINEPGYLYVFNERVATKSNGFVIRGLQRALVNDYLIDDRTDNNR